MRLFYNNKNNENNKNNNNNNNVYLTPINCQSKRVHDYNKRFNQEGDASCKVCGDATSENAVAEKKAYIMNVMKGIEITMNPKTSVSTEARDYNISITYYESPKICGAC